MTIGPYLFWNQICTDRSVMLISDAIRSRVAAVGVGFLLNSTSRVTNWSWVARCLFWFLCCWVRVLFLGGRRGADPWVGVEVDWASGEGEGDTIASSADCIMALGESKPKLARLGGRMNRGSSEARRLCLSMVVRLS